MRIGFEECVASCPREFSGGGYFLRTHRHGILLAVGMVHDLGDDRSDIGVDLGASIMG
jgi:hypothetical protein